MNSEDNELLCVFVLLGSIEHAGYDPLLVFEHQCDAEALKKKAEDYDAKRPECPDCTDNGDECETQWREYENALLHWINNHPVRNGYGFDAYIVCKLPFQA